MSKAAARMNCLDDEGLALLLGPAAGADRTAALAHLGDCGRCSALVAELVQLSMRGSTSPATPSEVLPRGAELGRYLMLDRLGAGAMGTVYAAYDPSLERKVALKVLRAAPERTQLLDEARVMARLAHPNVVQVFEVGEDEGVGFLAMELISGGTLTHWLRTPRTWREVLRIFVDAGHGLEAAHDAGLLHRDFKPDNVLVGDDGRARVSDFGLGGTQATARAGLFGTPAYLSPEAFAGQQPGPASDQFAFCVSLYEALHGERPFTGNTVLELARSVSEGPPREPPRTVPTRLQRAVTRGLAREPAHRFPSMHELVAELEAAGSNVSRRVFTAAVTLGSALVVAALVGWFAGARVDRCEGGALDVRQVWNAENRARLTTAFQQTGLPFAARAAEVAGLELDRYANAWATLQRDACDAPRTRGEPADTVTLRLACLSVRREALRTLVETLAQADRAMVEGASRATASLPALDDCSDLQRLLSPVALPADPRVQERIAESRQDAARSQVLLGAGRTADALAMADQAVSVAADAGFSPALAEARFTRAEVLRVRGEFVPAATELEDALWLAEAANVPEVVGRAATSLVRVRGARLAAFDEGERWRKHAEAALSRVGQPALLRAELLGSVGLLRTEQGRYAEAAEADRAALSLLVGRLGADASAVLTLRLQLAAVLRRQGSAEDSRREAATTAEMIERTLGPDHPLLADALNACGQAAAALGQHAEAIERYQRASAVLERSLGPENLRRAQILANLAAELERTGQLAESLAAHDAALVVKRAKLPANSPSILMSRQNRANTLARLGKKADALEEHRDVLALRRSALGAQHPDVAMSLSNVGQLLRELGRAGEAYDAHSEALRIEEVSLGKSHPDLAWDLTGQAEALVMLGRAAEAEAPARRALDLCEKSGDVELRATTRFVLARALERTAPAAALEFAHQAAAELGASTEASQRRHEVQHWLERHALR